MLITFEGIDGAGKSTHIEPLAQKLREAGLEVVVTREPGGTDLAERIRALLLAQSMDVVTEVLLAFAARRDHVMQVIQPALARGAVVLCDRFTDSTYAYQGSMGISDEMIAQLAAWTQEGIDPDLTLWFRIPPEVAAERRSAARQADRFEQRELDFFAAADEAYRRRQESQPQRVVVIDALQTVDRVWDCVQEAASTRIDLGGRQLATGPRPRS